MEVVAKKIIEGPANQLAASIDIFHRDYDSKSSFDELNNENLRERLWEALFKYLTDDKRAAAHQKCLSTLRMLSRDKTDLDKLITDGRLTIILNLARLMKQNNEVPYSNVTIEALKVLCNLLFNSPKVQQELPNTPCLTTLVARMESYTAETSQELLFFDARLVFLITALNVSTRKVLKVDLGCDLVLVKILTDMCAKCNRDNKRSIEPQDVDLVCEVLRALFNLYINASETELGAIEKSANLVSVLYKLLVLNSGLKRDELQKNIVNVLIVTPLPAYKFFIPSPSCTTRVIFDHLDVTAIKILLEYLDRKLNSNENVVETLSPALSALVRLTKAERCIRRYVRVMVLPPLTNVMKRPEEGTTMRAKLCKLLTSPITELKDLAGDFLFILCKEKVLRMIKYTGYGNAAGMFANRGLLAPCDTWDYDSSDSEDSDTEEYRMYRSRINPVTGCYEHPKPNPLAGMSEEQKEYEAMQLVGLVDRLSRGGIVQPCRIGDDGKPKPIEHVLELQKELPKQQLKRRDSDSD